MIVVVKNVLIIRYINLPRYIDTYATTQSGTVKIIMAKNIEVTEANLCNDCKIKLALILEKLPYISFIGATDGEATMTWEI